MEKENIQDVIADLQAGNDPVFGIPKHGLTRAINQEFDSVINYLERNKDKYVSPASIATQLRNAKGRLKAWVEKNVEEPSAHLRESAD